MKNVLATIAIAATFSAPAFAEAPLNSTVTGGQGVASVDGQALVVGGALAGGTIAAVVVVGVVTLVTITNDDGTVTTVTTGS